MVNMVKVWVISISAPTSLVGASKLTFKQNSILVFSCLHIEGKSSQILSLCLPYLLSKWVTGSLLFLVLILSLVCLCFLKTSHTEGSCFVWFNASCYRHAAFLHWICNLSIDVIDVPRGFCAWSSGYPTAAEISLASSMSETRCEKIHFNIIWKACRYCKIDDQYNEKI